MKFFKSFILTILTILFLAVPTLYLGFIFILPNHIDLDKYTPEMTKFIKENTGYQIETKGVKVKTSWDLSLLTIIDKTDLMDSRGKKFAQINGFEIDTSLIPLFSKEIKIKKIKADKVLANFETEGQALKDFYALLDKQNQQKTNKTSSFRLKTSDKMPEINIGKYRLSILDSSNNYTFKGQSFKISDFVLNKKIKLTAQGDIILNGQRQIAYNIVCSKLLGEKVANERNQKDISNFTALLKDLYNYRVRGDISADLNIKNDSDIDGRMNFDKISFVFAGKQFPKSSLKLDFKGDKAKINSSLHIDNNSKLLITGFFKTGKNKYIDLNVSGDEVKIGDVLTIAKTMSKPLGGKNIDNMVADGLIKAQFSIKSDFKKIKSNGYLKIKNANITDRKYNSSLNSLNADVDFSQDTIKIKKATAKLNSQPISIVGDIDKNAVANILISGKNLNLKNVLATSGNSKILNENDIQSGVVDVTAIVKGRLDKVVPKIDLSVSRVYLINKKSGAQVRLPRLVLVPQENSVTINKTAISVDDIKMFITGTITNINSKPQIKILTVQIPNKNIKIKGYPGSNLILSGEINASGDINHPKIQGLINVPMVKIPQNSIMAVNTQIKIDKKVTLTCYILQINKFIMNNIASDVEIANGKINLTNLIANAYFGKIAGNLSYDLSSKKLTSNIQGRGLSANPALTAMTGKDSKVMGRLDFDSNASLINSTKREILKNISGSTKFIISNGQMGTLGKFEHLLYAQNVVSNNVFRATLNAVAKAATVKNTGVYKYMKGQVAFSNGWANINWIKSSGPSMSLYITGRYYMPDNIASLAMLGRISDDVVKILGPIGEFSVSKAISSIPKIGEITEFLASQLTTNPNYENISQIPMLSPKTELPTKEFKVIIVGNAQSQASVKSFKWLSKPKVVSTAEKTSNQNLAPQQNLPDFVKNLPDYNSK